MYCAATSRANCNPGSVIVFPLYLQKANYTSLFIVCFVLKHAPPSQLSSLLFWPASPPTIASCFGESPVLKIPKENICISKSDMVSGL